MSDNEKDTIDITIRISTEVEELLRQGATKRGLSRAAYARLIILSHLDTERPPLEAPVGR